ncbi:MAG TPA: tRNA (adenosine(37)-N6)-dimethylallyltransferase MiaA [Candidatus Limnocylindrales bacterium]|nr:tRNA (adenosine(37)-N6)-dimethylallyltransferase MiaA [Candidatus Limnocylindrales bacterium]
MVGPTASGKSALALEVAARHDGEIVAADSRQVYRGMDIGTAKPTREERARVPHHMLDVVEPGERYDAARYQRDARAALDDIAERGRTAVVVGGTGLYVRALLDGLDLASVPTDPDLRAQLEAEGDRGVDLHERLAALDPEAAARVDRRNVRRVVRYLEASLITGGVSAQWRKGDRVSAVKIGLAPDRAWLVERIERRVRSMVEEGVLDEARGLMERGIDPRLPSMSAHGYVHWMAHLRGEIGLEQAVALTVRDTKAYSRRQMTWFRRDAAIRWCDPATTDPVAFAAAALANAA